MHNIFSVRLVDGITAIRFTQKPEFSDIIQAIDEASKTDAEGLRLWDLSAGLDLSDPQLRQIAEYGKNKLPASAKVAIVAPQDLTFGITRVYEVYRKHEQLDFMVFRTEQEAIKWLKPEQTF